MTSELEPFEMVVGAQAFRVKVRFTAHGSLLEQTFIDVTGYEPVTLATMHYDRDSVLKAYAWLENWLMQTDPTHGQINLDIQKCVAEIGPRDISQRVAMENTLQDRQRSPAYKTEPHDSPHEIRGGYPSDS